MGKNKVDNRLFFYQSVLAGGASGLLSGRTFVAGFSVLKIIAQVGSEEARSHGGYGSTIAKIYGKDLYRKGFWRGNTSALIRLMSYNGLQFGVFAKLKSYFTDPYTGTMTTKQSFIAGSSAGVVATLITHPLDVIKTRRAICSARNPKFQNVTGLGVILFSQEGFVGLYRGLSASVIGVIPFAGITFVTYEMMERAWNKPKRRMNFYENFVNGAVAGIAGQSLTYPIDTIRKKMQAHSVFLPPEMQPDVKFHGFVDCFVQTVRNNGVLGLWRGFLPNAIKVIPHFGFTFAVYEFWRRKFMFSNGYTETPYQEIPRPGIDQTLRPHELRAFLVEHRNVTNSDHMSRTRRLTEW